MLFPHGGAAEIFRDFEGAIAHYPDKAEIRDWGGAVEGAILIENTTTQAWITGSTSLSLQDVIVTTGYAEPRDGGGGIWKRALAEPAHDAKRQFTDGSETAWYELIGSTINPKMCGASNTGMIADGDDSDAFNAAARRAVELDSPFATGGDYYLAKTVAPGGRLTWNCSYTRLLFLNSDTSGGNFAQVMEYPDGVAELTPSGRYVALDTRDMGRTDVIGTLVIQGAFISSARFSERAKVNSDLVAVTTSQGSSSRMSFIVLEIIGFGWGFYQGDQRGRGGTELPFNLPYTRWKIGRLEIKFCNNTIETGSSGDGFDDAVIGACRIGSSWGRGTIRGTDFNCQNLFLEGLQVPRDYETQTVTLTAGSTAADLSADHSGVEVGTVLGFSGGALNKNGDSIQFVTKIIGKSGLQLTLERAPEETVPAASFVISPPTFKLAGSDLRCTLVYPENIHDVALWMDEGCTASDGVIRSGSVYMAGRYDAPVLITGRGNVFKMSLESVAWANPAVKRHVAVSVDEHIPSGRIGSKTVEVGAPRSKDQYIYANPVEVVSIYNDHDVANVQARNGFIMPKAVIRSHYSGESWVIKNYRSADPHAFEVLAEGRAFGTAVTLADVVASGNFTTSDGGVTYDKAPGGAGLLQLNATAGKLYRIKFEPDAWEAGEPQFLWFGGGQTISVEFDIFELDGVLTAYSLCPPGAAAARLFAFTGDEFSVKRFELQEMLPV